MGVSCRPPESAASVKPIRMFPMDGFADTCVGYGNAADGGCDLHGTNDDLSKTNGLCAECDARLQAEIRASFQQHRAQQVANLCPGGCKDHAHGSRYYGCLCCYGD